MGRVATDLGERPRAIEFIDLRGCEAHVPCIAAREIGAAPRRRRLDRRAAHAVVVALEIADAEMEAIADAAFAQVIAALVAKTS